MFGVTAGTVAADMIHLVALRDFLQAIMGPVDVAVEHLSHDGAVFGLPALPKVSVSIRLVRDADGAARVQFLEHERAAITMRQWVVAQLSPTLTSTSVGHFHDA